MARYFVIINC